MISDYRSYKEKPELNKLLKNSCAESDPRLFPLLKNIDYYFFNNDFIQIKEDKFESIFNQCKKLSMLIHNGKIINGIDNPELYEDMLYSNNSFIDFHEKNQA